MLALYDLRCRWAVKQTINKDPAGSQLEQFTSILLDVANETIPKSSGRLSVRKRPWFNDDCKSAISARKEALKKFLHNPTQDNLDRVRVFRAKARRTIKTIKRDNWKSYVSKLNSSTSAKKYGI